MSIKLVRGKTKLLILKDLLGYPQGICLSAPNFTAIHCDQNLTTIKFDQNLHFDFNFKVQNFFFELEIKQQYIVIKT
jgi:hypothetical protein